MPQETGLLDQTAIRAWGREFAERVIMPVARELDAQPTAELSFSWDVVEQAAAVGMRTLTLSAEAGGAGFDTESAAAVVEELARADAGVAALLAETLALVQVLERHATPGQLGALVPRMRDEPRFLLALALAEPELLLDSVLLLEDGADPFHTTASRADGGWILGGRKHLVTGGSRAGLLLVAAQTEAGRGLAAGSTCFLVDAGTPGLTVARLHEKMGQRFSGDAELTFDGCFVPDSAVLGAPGRGFDVLAEMVPRFHAYQAAGLAGVATAAWDHASEWSRTRVQGGRPIIGHGAVAAKVGEMAALVELARAHAQAAARAADGRGRWDAAAGAAPEEALSRLAWRVMVSAMEVHGGYGFMKALVLEKLVRDAAGYLHSGGAATPLLARRDWLGAGRSPAG